MGLNRGGEKTSWI
jgi:hypothetical protein